MRPLRIGGIRDLVAGALALAVLATTTTASAQSTPSQAVLEETRERFVHATMLFEQGSYAAALEEFRRVYALMPRPQVLFNIAMCHRELGQYAEAVAALKIFLEQGGARGDRETRAEIDRVITELMHLAAEQEADDDDSASSPPSSDDEEPDPDASESDSDSE